MNYTLRASWAHTTPAGGVPVNVVHVVDVARLQSTMPKGKNSW